MLSQKSLKRRLFYETRRSLEGFLLWKVVSLRGGSFFFFFFSFLFFFLILNEYRWIDSLKFKQISLDELLSTQKTYLLGKFSRLWCGFCLRWMFRLVQWHSILLATIDGTSTRKIIENTWKLSIWSKSIRPVPIWFSAIIMKLERIAR